MSKTTNRETEGLTIDLVQPWWVVEDVRERDLWNEASLACHVERSKADLVVFPECYPFCPDAKVFKRPGKSIQIAVDQGRQVLMNLAKKNRRAIVAGGYFRVGEKWQNASVFAAPRAVSSVYYKRILWKSEKGNVAAANIGNDVPFELCGYRVIPLICSDVFGDSERSAKYPTGTMTKIVDQTKELAQQRERSLVLVTSYAQAPTGPLWSERLQHLSATTQRPVLYCNFAGNDGGGFGGGGSGVFLPDGNVFRVGNAAAVLRVTIEPRVANSGTGLRVIAQSL